MTGRSSFTGTIEWGDVRFGVRGYPVTADPDLEIHLVHPQCKTAISFQKICPACHAIVTIDDLSRGVKTDQGWIILTPEEHDRTFPEVGQTVLFLHQTINPHEVDFSWQEQVYYVVPSEDSDSKPYAVLARSLKEEGLYAVVTYRSYRRTYLGILRPTEHGLMLTKLHFIQALRTLSSLGMSIEPESLSSEEITVGRQLVRSMATQFLYGSFFSPEALELRKLVQAKLAKGQVMISTKKEVIQVTKHLTKKELEKKKKKPTREVVKAKKRRHA